MTTKAFPDTGLIASGGLQHSVEQFLFHEAELLDNREFVEWSGLLTEDITYRMPTRRNVPLRNWKDEVGRENELAHYEDDRRTLLARIERLGTPIAWAEIPPTRTRRIIGNVRVGSSQSDGSLPVKSNFILYSNRRDTTGEVFAGERLDVLRATDPDSWAIASRVILLDQTVLLTDSLTIFF